MTNQEIAIENLKLMHESEGDLKAEYAFRAIFAVLADLEGGELYGVISAVVANFTIVQPHPTEALKFINQCVNTAWQSSIDEQNAAMEQLMTEKQATPGTIH